MKVIPLASQKLTPPHDHGYKYIHLYNTKVHFEWMLFFGVDITIFVVMANKLKALPSKYIEAFEFSGFYFVS